MEFGVEQEFELYDARGKRVDARRLLPSLLKQAASEGVGQCRFRNLKDAALLSAGYVVSADGCELELSTAPILFAEGPSVCAQETVRVRRDLLERVARLGDLHSKGYSTHISVSAERPNEIVWHFANVVSPVLQSLIDGPESPGLVVRARRGRIEITGEYIDDPEDLAAAILVAAIGVHICHHGTPFQLPACRVQQWERGIQRGGIYLPPTAFGDEPHLLGRNAVFFAENEQPISLQNLLDHWLPIAEDWGEKHPHFQTAIDGLRRRVRGQSELAIERSATSVPVIYPRKAVCHIPQMAVAFGRLVPFDKSVAHPVFVDWDAICFGSGPTVAGNRRSLDQLLADRQTGKLEHMLGQHRGGVALASVDQVAEVATFASIALEELAIDAEGQKPPTRTPPDHPDPVPCAVKLSLNDLCVGEKSRARATPNGNGTLSFRVVYGPLAIVAVRGRVADVVATGPGPAALEVTFKRPDGCVAKDVVDIEITGAVLIPESFRDTGPLQRTPFALAGTRVWVQVNTMTGVAPKRAVPVTSDEADPGSSFDYQVEISGSLSDEVKTVVLNTTHSTHGTHVATIGPGVFRATVILRGLGFHRIGVIASDANGNETETRAEVKINTTRAPDDAPGTLATAALKTALTALKAPQPVDQLGQQIVAANQALGTQTKAAVQQIVSQRNRIEETNVSVDVIPEITTPPGSNAAYVCIGFGPDPDTATIAVGGVSEVIKLSPHPARPNHVVSIDPKRIVFRHGPPKAQRVGDTLEIFAQPGDDVTITRAGCTDTLPVFGVATATKTSAWGVSMNDNAQAQTAEIEFKAVVVPESWEGNMARLEWSVISRPSAQVTDLEPKTLHETRLSADELGRYIVQAEAYFDTAQDNRTAGHVIGHVVSGSPYLTVDDSGWSETDSRYTLSNQYRNSGVAQGGLVLSWAKCDDVPPFNQMAAEWAWSASDLTGSRVRTAVLSLETGVDFQFRKTNNPSFILDLTGLSVSGKAIRTPGFRRSLGPFRIVAGPAHKIKVSGSRDRGRNWHEITSYKLTNDVYPPATPAGGLPVTLQPTLQNSRDLWLRVEAWDDDDMPVRDGVQASWRLAGGGRITQRAGASMRTTKDGAVHAKIRSELEPTRQLLIVQVDEVAEYFGNPIHTASGQFSAVGGATSPPSTASSVQLVDRNERAQITFRPFVELGQQKIPVPAGTEVLISVAPGSVWDATKRHFTTVAPFTVSSAGDVRFRVSPKAYAADGTRNWLRPEAFGEFMVTARMQGHAVTSTGRIVSASKFYWSNWPLNVRPRVVLPHSGQVRQSDIGWSPKPGVGALDVTGSAPDRSWRVEGAPNKTTFVDLEETGRKFEPHATFSPWSLASSKLTSTAGYGVSQAIKLTASGGPLIGAAISTSPSATGDPAGGLLTVVEASVAPVKLSSTDVHDLSAFELDFWIRPDGRLDSPFVPWHPDYDRFTLLSGGGPTRQHGQWSLTLDYNDLSPSPAEWVFRYSAKGCANRAAVNLTARLAGATTGWIAVKLSVRCDPGRDQQSGWVQVQLTINGVAKRATASTFNWIPGASQTFEFFGSTRNDYDLAGLVLSREMNPNLNFVTVPRSGNTPEHLAPFLVRTLTAPGSSTTGELHLSVRRRPQPTIPTFSKDFERFASTVSGYCSTGSELTRVDIAAASTPAIEMQNTVVQVLAQIVTGEGSGGPAFVAEFAAGFSGVADLRDIAKTLAHCVPGGQDPNWLDFTLAVLGLISTASTVVTSGGAAPANVAVAVLRPALKHIDDVMKSAGKLRPFADDLTKLVSEEAKALLLAWRRVGNGADIASVSLAIAPILSALTDFYMSDPVIRTRAARLEEFGREYMKANDPITAALPLGVFGPFQFVKFAATKPQLAANASQDLRDVADAAYKKTKSLLAVLNTSAFNPYEFISAIRALKDIDVPAGRAGEIREMLIKRFETPAIQSDELWENWASFINYVDPQSWVRANLDVVQFAQRVNLPEPVLTFNEVRALMGFNRSLAGMPNRANASPVTVLLDQLHLQAGPSDAFRERLSVVANHINAVMSCGRVPPSSLPSDFGRGNTPADVARFMRLSVAGRSLTGIVDSSVKGTFWEMDVVHLFFHAGVRRIILDPQVNGKKAADLLLELTEETFGLPRGLWTSEVKAISFNPRYVDQFVRQFARRVEQVSTAGVPFDFAYFFRGPYDQFYARKLREQAQAMLKKHGISEVETVIRTPAGEISRRVAYDWNATGGQKLRLHMDFAGMGDSVIFR